MKNPGHLTARFCNTLYMGLFLKTTRKVQLVQNVPVQAVFRNREHYHLHLPDPPPQAASCFWVRLRILVDGYKALRGIGVSCLRDPNNYLVALIQQSCCALDLFNLKVPSLGTPEAQSLCLQHLPSGMKFPRSSWYFGRL